MGRLHGARGVVPWRAPASRRRLLYSSTAWLEMARGPVFPRCDNVTPSFTQFMYTPVHRHTVHFYIFFAAHLRPLRSCLLLFYWPFAMKVRYYV